MRHFTLVVIGAAVMAVAGGAAAQPPEEPRAPERSGAEGPAEPAASSDTALSEADGGGDDEDEGETAVEQGGAAESSEALEERSAADERPAETPDEVPARQKVLAASEDTGPREERAADAPPASASDSGPAIELPEEHQDGEIAPSEEREAEEDGPDGEEEQDALFASLWEKPFLSQKGRRITLGGYGETEFHHVIDGPTYFDHHRLVVFLYAQLIDFISFAAEIEWEHGGSPRKSNGQLDVGEVLLEFAVVDVRITEWLQLRGGIVLVPFGSFNIRHDAPTRDLGVRPMAIKYLVPSTWFETGAGAFGRFELPHGMELNYEAYFINGFDTKIYDGLGMRAARGSLGEDNNRNKAFVAHLAYLPMPGIEIGTSFYRGAYDPDGKRFVNMYGVDVTTRFGPVEVLGELIGTHNDPGFDEGWPEASRQSIPERMLGFFGQVNLHVMPAALRALMSGQMQEEATFTLSLRYGEVDTDRDEVTAGDRSRLTTGLNFRPIEAFVWKNEFLFQSNGATGELARPFTHNWDPTVRYVSSVAFLF